MKSLVEIVRQHVSLKESPEGVFLGLCPFHNEETPSFVVLEKKNAYFCFSCGAEGDTYEFKVMLKHSHGE